jgi:hypothetical protein
LCGYFATKSSGIHVIDESALAVDLDDRQPLPILRLEPRIPVDVDLLDSKSASFRTCSRIARARSQRWQPSA